MTATHKVQRRRLLISCAKLGVATVVAPSIGAVLAHATPEPLFGSGYAAGDGARLFFVRVGEGPLMLFLHGHPDNALLYESQLREFGRDHLAVAPHLRGYAPSDAPEAVEAYAMPRLLGDVHSLLDHFGMKRCTLVGNDWGGYVAWVFASAYPSRVERLIILKRAASGGFPPRASYQPGPDQGVPVRTGIQHCGCPISRLVQLLSGGSDQGAGLA